MTNKFPARWDGDEDEENGWSGYSPSVLASIGIAIVVTLYAIALITIIYYAK